MSRPTLKTLAARALRDHQLVARGDTVLCACSGGPDSMALLHALWLLRDELGIALVAGGVDHGLRREAKGELSLVGEQAKAWGIPFAQARLKVKLGGNLQQRARQARHRALQRLAREHAATAIALGHSADDRAETLMMRLLRGAGPRGLGVMGASADGLGGKCRLIRPLIAARRADVLAHLTRHGIRWADDPSNRDARFLRVRVRHELIPLLEELSPKVVEHLCALAEQSAGEQLTYPQALLAPYPKGLNRAQRDAIERAIVQRQGGTTVRLSGGRALKVAFFRGAPVVFLV
jgi:tRNA(Ile)-lysidine synthase